MKTGSLIVRSNDPTPLKQRDMLFRAFDAERKATNAAAPVLTLNCYGPALDGFEIRVVLFCFQTGDH
jgi:hypothetical protein